jgi:type IV secretion system protein TrbL
MDFNGLTDSLNNFITAFTAGQTRADGLGGTIVNGLLVIEICMFGLAMAAGATQLWDVFRRMLGVGMWLYIVRHFSGLAKIFVDSVVAAGLIAGGRPGEVSLVRDPSAIAGMFLDVTNPIMNKFEHLHWDVGEKVMIGFVWMLLALPFLAMACAMFAAVVDYYLVRLLATVLIPFALNQHTRFLAEKGINGVIAAGLKLMVLATILAITEPVLKAVKIDATFNWRQLWDLFFTAASCGWVVWSAPRTASTLLFGSPGLSSPPLAAAAGAVALNLASRAATTVYSHMKGSSPPPPPAMPPPGGPTAPPTPPRPAPSGPGNAPSSAPGRATGATPPTSATPTSGTPPSATQGAR